MYLSGLTEESARRELEYASGLKTRTDYKLLGKLALAGFFGYLIFKAVK